MPTTTLLITIAGIMHAGVLAAAAMIPVKTDWRTDLARLSPFTRQLVWTHAGYITLLIAAFGVLSVVFADQLTGGDPLGRAVSGFIALFWTIRLCLSCWMKPRAYLTSRLLWVGYVVLLATFAYFAVVYTWVAIGG